MENALGSETTATTTALGAEGTSFCEVESREDAYVLKLALNEKILKDLELEYCDEELTITAQIELQEIGVQGRGTRLLNFEQSFVLPGAHDGKGIEVSPSHTEVWITVPKSGPRSRRSLCSSPSVYYRPALN